MKKFLSAIFLSCALLSVLPVRGQQADMHFVRYDKSSSALAYDGVRTLIQDSRGYIWAGTYKGLSRFDGVRWRTFDRHDFSTNGDYISSLAEDARGNVWIGTDEGAVVYFYNEDRFVHMTGDGAPDNRTYAIECLSDGSVFLGVREEGLYRYDPASGTFTLLWDRPDNAVYRIASGADGRLYLATYCDNLYVMDPSDPGSVAPLCGSFFETDNIEGLSRDGRFLYVASKRYGLCRVDVYDRSVTVVCRIPDDARPVNVGASGGYVLLSTTNGIRRYDPATEEVMPIRMEEGNIYGLPDNFVNCAIYDSCKGLWVSTDEGGVCYTSPQMDRFIRFKCPGMVKGFAQDKSSRVWVATERSGLFHFSPVDRKLEKYINPALPSDINALCADGDNLWLGSHGGLFRLNTASGKVKLFSSVLGSDPNLDNRVVSIFLSREHTLYVGTNLGVSRYNPDEDSFRQVECLQGITVENMAQDLSGNIWMATYSQGVVLYDPSADSLRCSYNIKDGKSSIPEMTSSICVDRQGCVWVVGFSSGFFRLEGNDFHRFDRSTLPALPSDVYFNAVSDAGGDLWLSSDTGLLRYCPSSGSVRTFSTADGLLGERFRKGGIALRDGKILMGGEMGFVMFDPEDFTREESIRRVAVVDVLIDGDRPSGDNFKGNADLAQRIVLSPRERNISFSFAFPGLFGSPSGTLLCRLEGVDRQWRDVTSTANADYYSLPKGKHTLKLALLQPDGDLAAVHGDVEVEVLPRFYESVLGLCCIFTAALLLFTSLFWIIYRKGLSRQSRQHREKEKALKEDLYHEKMSFFANVIHEIKTPLTLVRTPLQHLMMSDSLPEDSREDVVMISNNTDNLEKLVRELLEFISLEEHGYVLELRNIDLSERLGFICSNYTGTARNRNVRLECRGVDAGVVNAVDSRAFNRMVNNLLSNAVKYAETYVCADMRVEDGKVLVSFRNDGEPIPQERRESIFKPFVHYGTPSQGENSFGIGLSYARKLSRMHGGDIVLSERTDCTEFVISLPVHRVCETADADGPATERPSAEDASSSRPLVLVVEDNPDLLDFLKRKLSADYLVTGVSSAEKALEKLRSSRVDVLLTDLGLKSMSGVELCAKVNADPSLAHIPIIVLSAISTLQTKMKCMENGASMYIEKPFSLDYLLSCIKSVLEKKESIKSAYAPGRSALELVQSGLPDRDDDFVRRLDRLIAENISDPEFCNRQLEENLGVSHSSLNRKMKALLGTTPNEYIRRRRLDVASSMLERGGVRVSEICFAVGFNSPSYFAKCFKEVYGVLPTEYCKRNNVAESGE